MALGKKTPRKYVGHKANLFTARYRKKYLCIIFSLPALNNILENQQKYFNGPEKENQSNYYVTLILRISRRGDPISYFIIDYNKSF